MLKSYFLHTSCHNSNILIIYRELLNSLTAYTYKNTAWLLNTLKFLYRICAVIVKFICSNGKLAQKMWRLQIYRFVQRVTVKCNKYFFCCRWIAAMREATIMAMWPPMPKVHTDFWHRVSHWNYNKRTVKGEVKFTYNYSCFIFSNYCFVELYLNNNDNCFRNIHVSFEVQHWMAYTVMMQLKPSS